MTFRDRQLLSTAKGVFSLYLPWISTFTRRFEDVALMRLLVLSSACLHIVFLCFYLHIFTRRGYVTKLCNYNIKLHFSYVICVAFGALKVRVKQVLVAFRIW
jgi:hypothetical protein